MSLRNANICSTKVPNKSVYFKKDVTLHLQSNFTQILLVGGKKIQIRKEINFYNWKLLPLFEHKSIGKKHFWNEKKMSRVAFPKFRQRPLVRLPRDNKYARKFQFMLKRGWMG